MRRVLIVATTSYAGMGPYVAEIVRSFHSEDEVYFFFHDFEDDYYRNSIEERLMGHSVFVKEANSKFNKLYSLVTNSSTYEYKIFRTCRRFAIDVVHFINGCPSVRFQKRLASRNISLLSTVHDLTPHEAKKEWYKMLRQRIGYIRLTENVAFARNLVTNSMHQYEHLKDLYPEKNIYYHSFPSLVTDSITKGNDVPSELCNIDRPFILFFGRIEAYKGIDILYDAYKNSSYYGKCYLVIAGAGTLLNRAVHDDANVIFINRYIKDSEVAFMYRKAQCVVYPYVSATQSGVLSIAFYFMTPTIVSDVPFFKSIVSDNGTALLFKAGSSDELKGSIESIMNTDCSEMKERQRDYYKKNYQNDAIRESLLKIYGEVK